MVLAESIGCVKHNREMPNFIVIIVVIIIIIIIIIIVILIIIITIIIIIVIIIICVKLKQMNLSYQPHKICHVRHYNLLSPNQLRITIKDISSLFYLYCLSDGKLSSGFNDLMIDRYSVTESWMDDK